MLRVFTIKTIAIALLSHLSQFCVFWLSLRTFCIWLPLPYRLSLRGVQASDPLLYPCCIFLCRLPTVNHQCSSEVEAVVLQALRVLCRWTKELWLKQIFASFSSGSVVSTIYLNSLIQPAMPHPIGNLFWHSLWWI